MSSVHEIAATDDWRCWLCDEAVDPDMSPNDGRAASIDTRITKSKAKKKSKEPLVPRLAHRQCNTGKGGVEPVIEWAHDLFVVDPAPIIASTDRLVKKGGREIMARCPTAADADDAAAWLLDRLTRLHPDVEFTSEVTAAGGQYLLVLQGG